MENRVITIARSYGSGGRKMGRLLAKELGYEYYDREILRIASDESGISEELFNQVDERQHLPLFRIAREAYTGEVIPPDSDDFISNENLFRYQAKIIRELAATRSCVIVGRCATNILKDKSLKIFIHAPFEERVQNVIRRTGREEASARKLVKKMDKERKAYYEYFTDSKWLDMTQYDLCIDSSRFSMEQIIEIVKRCL